MHLRRVQGPEGSGSSWAVDGKPKTGNPADYHQQDGETIAIGFLPEGVDLDFPPDACAAFDNISDDPSLAGVLSPGFALQRPVLDELDRARGHRHDRHR